MNIARFSRSRFGAQPLPSSSHIHTMSSSSSCNSVPLTAVTEASLDLARETHPFLQYYQLLSHQQNMLQDSQRTGTYRQAMLLNKADFKDKVVLDVGCGTGILSLFAAQAGAKRVYAVEASDAAETARLLIRKNNMSHIITVIKGKVEEVELPEMVDVVVSEPIGFLLVHERMLESYVAARDRFVKPEILNSNQKHFMYPAQGTICVLPFTDPALVQDVATKSQFWRTSDFYGVDLSCLERHALAQNFSQPVIGYFDTNILIASEDEIVTHAIDFRTAHVRKDFVDIDIPFRFCISRTTIMHGLGCWFDADFFGSENHVVLSTSPKFPGTHWYQVRLLLSRPLAVNVGQIVVGHMRMKVNAKFSYDIELEAEIENVPQVPRSVNHIFLHDPYYHYLGASQNGAMAHDAVFVDAYHDLAKDFVMPNGNENHEDAKMLV